MPHIQKVFPQQVPPTDKWNEQILVVKRDALFPDGAAWQGLKEVDFEWYLETIKTHKEFVARGPAETNPLYKQIIPYLVFEHDNKYFLMQRDAKASETRLASNYSLGIGGHLRQTDITGKTLFEWATREFHEEINYSGDLLIQPLGILNDDSNEVGKVHIGFVLLLKGSLSDISIKSELANGALLTLQECEQLLPRMETWSQIVFEFLKKRIS